MLLKELIMTDIKQLKNEVKQQLDNKDITEEEYFEWKINWPASSSLVDQNGTDKGNASYNWRK